MVKGCELVLVIWRWSGPSSSTVNSDATNSHWGVDELRLMSFPVVLGTGKRLFGETSDKKRLRLAESKTVGDGIAIAGAALRIADIEKGKM